MSVLESKVFYLMGPSGSGKDALMRRCRGLITEADRCFVAHRYITRPPELEGENHIWLSDLEFAKRVRLGAFAMHWWANGYHYGTGSEMDVWLDQGINVLVNGSRGFLGEARRRYRHRLVPLLLQVDSEVLLQRLQRRGREDEAQIRQRIERAHRFDWELDPGIERIDNNGTLEAGARRLMALIRHHSLLSVDSPDRAFWH